MPRFIALLRGINVGGHRVKMTDLKSHFEDLGFTAVETFIASGNVVFDSPSEESSRLENLIEEHLRKRLGYDVPTFLRTRDEIARIAAYAPFPALHAGEGIPTLSVMFMGEAAPPAMQTRLSAFETDIDRLHVHGREIYWLCGLRSSDSLIDWPRLSRELPLPRTTVRNVTTVRRMAEKYPPA